MPYGSAEIERMSKALEPVCPMLKDLPDEAVTQFWRELFATGVEPDQIVAWASNRLLHRSKGEKFDTLADVLRQARILSPGKPAKRNEIQRGSRAERPAVLDDIEAWLASLEPMPEQEDFPDAVQPQPDGTMWQQFAHIHDQFTGTSPHGGARDLIDAAGITERDLSDILDETRKRFARVVPTHPDNPFARDAPPNERYVWHWWQARSCACVTYLLVRLAWERGVDVESVVPGLRRPVGGVSRSALASRKN